jgi:SAM-dependent methyltransferase
MKTFLYRDFHYLEERHWWFVGRQKIIFTLIQRYAPQPARILDAGCGAGYTTSALRRFGEVFAFDSAPEAVAYAMERELQVKQGEMTAIPYADEDFEVVTALDVLEHAENDKLALTELWRVMKTGGALFFTVPAYRFLWSPHDDVNQHKRRYTAKEVRAKMAETGFSLLKLSYYNTLLFPPIAATRAFRRLFPAAEVENRSDFSLPYHGGINTILTSLFTLEARLLRSMNFPFGVSLVGVAKKLGPGRKNNE